MGEPISTVGQLAGICGHDGDNWEKVLIDASKRLVVAIAAFTAAVEVTQDTPGDLLMGQHQYDGSTWQKSNLLYGYNEQWIEQVEVDGTATLWDIAISDPVPEGYIYVPQVVTAYHDDPAAKTVSTIYRASMIACYTNYETNVGSYQMVVSPYMGTLVEGDDIAAGFYPLALEKKGYLRILGYKMKLAM